MMKFIFLDTFALRQLTNDYYKELNDYLEEQELHLVISSLQLMEYYSPIVEGGDRTARAIQLLATNPFVIVNQSDIYEEEENAYPTILKVLPYKLESEPLFANLNLMERMVVLYRMFHEGIPESGFKLKEWVTNHHASKSNWPQNADVIIHHAEETGSIKSKTKFLQSLDLRFCDSIVVAIENLNDKSKHDKQFYKSLTKLTDMQKRDDTRRMRGIHLSSLIFWYDYVIAKKTKKPSDEGDILHSMIFPYCSVVVTDNSRIDCLKTIQKKENRYKEVQFLTIKDFIAKLTG